MIVRFDDSLPRLADAVATELGDDALARGVVVRDITGRLAFFSSWELDAATADRLAQRLRDVLGPYARTDRVLALPSDGGATPILEEAETMGLRFVVGGRSIQLIDRRLVGADWLRRPAEMALPPPRFVFASLKGGVGRSTALSVIAAHLAATGRRALAIDLDVEAPGLGPFLLEPQLVPPFGTIDVMVEDNLGELDDEFLADAIAPSSLAAGGGRIDVVPAFGRRSLDNPADVLAKLARAYAEDVRADGTVGSVLDKVRGMVDRFGDLARYDAIFIDVRAGLHETTASAVLGLGAEVLLFGVDEPQTFEGYAALLAHLGRFVTPDEATPEWVDRLTGVHAKASASTDARDEFVERWRSLVDQHGPAPRRGSSDSVLPAEQFHAPAWDEDQADDVVLPQESSLHLPIAVLADDRYERFNPLARRDLLEEALYRTTFGALLDRVEAAIVAATGGTP